MSIGSRRPGPPDIALTATGPVSIAPAEGKLGVLCVGLGAVTSTLIAGVELARRGMGEPIGSLTQLGTIRLGTRTEHRVPLIHDFVPLAQLDDLVFGRWDPFPDDAYVAASRAGVLDAAAPRGNRRGAASGASDGGRVRPGYVKRLDGPNVKARHSASGPCSRASGKTSTSSGASTSCDRLVMIWCARPRSTSSPARRTWTSSPSKRAIDADDPTIAPSMLYAYAALQEGIPFINGAPNLTVDIPALRELADRARRPDLRQGLQDRPDAHQDRARADAQGPHAGLSGWYSTNILGNRDGEVLDDPESFKTKEESKLGVLEHILEPERVPRALRRRVPQGAHQLLPAPRRQQRGLGQHRHLRMARLPDADQGRLPVPRLDPRRPARARPGACSCDLAQRAGLGGIQEWLSFYFKSPQVAPGLYPEHDLFIQQTKLKNTLRWMMGEEQITHLGIDYYIDE